MWNCLRNLMAFKRSIQKLTVIQYIFEICEGIGRDYSFYFFNCIKKKNGALFLFKITNVLLRTNVMLLRTNHGKELLNFLSATMIRISCIVYSVYFIQSCCSNSFRIKKVWFCNFIYLIV